MFVNNDNNKILNLLKKLLNIYERNLRKKKYDNFYKFYYITNKQKLNQIEFNNNLAKKMNKRKKKIELFNKNSEDYLNNRNKYFDKNIQKNIMKNSTPITLRSFDESYYKNYNNNFNHHIKNPNLIFDDNTKQLLKHKNKKQINKNSKKFPINNQYYNNNKFHYKPYSNLTSFELPIYLRSDIERIKKEGNFNKYKDNVIQRPLSYNKIYNKNLNKLNNSNLRNSYDSYPKKTNKLNGISESLCLLFSSRLHKDNNNNNNSNYNLYNTNNNNNNYNSNLNDKKNIKKKKKKNEVSNSTFYDKGTNYITEKQSHEMFNNTQNLENTHQNINYSSSNSMRNNNNLEKQKDQFYTFRTGKIQNKINNNSVINPQKLINQQINSTKSTHFISPRYDGQMTEKINNNNNINQSNKSNLFESVDDQIKIVDTQNSKGKNTIILDNSGGINNSGISSNKSMNENINNKKKILFSDESKNKENISKNKDNNEEMVRSASIQSFSDAILLDIADRHLESDYDLERYQYLNKNKVQKHFYMNNNNNEKDSK